MGFKKLRKFKGAAIIFWKEENGKKFVLLGKRCGKHIYGSDYYSNFGGHLERSKDCEKGKIIYLNTAIRESAEETGVISDYGDHMDQARAFFLDNPDFKLNKKPFRKIHVPYYHHETFICKVSGKMAYEKWYKESREHYHDSIQWYALDNLPKPLLFACKLNILKVRFSK